MILEEENTQLQRYIDNLPTKPYCANSFDFGLLIRAKNTAVKHRHIQHNKHTSVAYIVLDVDHPFSLLMLQEQSLPEPNFLVINAKNFHAHVFYELSTPVHTTNVARAKPLRYLASIEYALREKWQADKSYSSLISKTHYMRAGSSYSFAMSRGTRRVSGLANTTRNATPRSSKRRLGS